MTVTVVELRCPSNPRKLLAKLRSEGGRPHVVDGNLMELACRDCEYELRRRGEGVKMVLHRYAFDGSLVETIYV